MAAAKTTTQRGLGWQHQKQRERLLRQHVDGTPCWWCGLPMWRDKDRNWDGKVLAADHTLSRAFASVQGVSSKADRLLHSICNKRRGDGSRDDQRPALTGDPLQALTVEEKALGHRAMPWP